MSILHQAASNGDLSQLRQLLDEGADIDSYNDRDGHTPLMSACLSPNAGLEVVEFLLGRGADIHAHSRAIYEENKPVIELAVRNASLEKIRLLIENGADVGVRPNGCTLLVSAAYAQKMDVFDLLVAAGAPIDGESIYRESALSVLSNRGYFPQVGTLLALGADPTPLEWTPLMRAIALGTLQDVQDILDLGADLEATDRWKRTPFLLSIQTGDTEKTALLLANGANRGATGRCGKPPMRYPIDRDDTRMLRWLIDQGFDLNQEDKSGHTPLMDAAENSAPGCFRLLVESGADWVLGDEEIVSRASHPEIVGMLYERGEDLSKLEAPILREFIGLGTAPDLPVSEQDFLQNRTRRFGNANPERMKIPFWNAMVRCGWAGYRAADQFGDDSFGTGNPVWCHDRFGMSLTRLPDGRFIQIAGEHEDHYDPDFCIYNDVIIHDGKGGFEILGYPEDVFPPTDFHSATHVAPWIYIIGNLGYHATREAHGFETPVYRLHIETLRIERVATHGKSPGWIHSHRATLQDGCIRVSGGKIYAVTSDGKSDIVDYTGACSLDLASMTWQIRDT
jgi:ankyrin repeat protein